MTGLGGGKASRAHQRALGGGTGAPPGTGLPVNSPNRVVCPRCESGIGRKCLNRWGAYINYAHPERRAAARGARS